jgi:hypothetical protein
MTRLAAFPAFLLATIAAPVLANPPQASFANFKVIFENPGVQNSTAVFDVKGVETFESRALGMNSGGFSTDFGTGGAIQATYTGGRIDNANVYGSAGGVGRHIVTFSNFAAPNNVIDVSFTSLLPQGLNFFGYWLSALDAGNRLEFFSGADSLGVITPASVIGALGGCPSVSNPYCGNPTGPFLGRVPNEQFAFLNVYFNSGVTYDRVRIFQVGGGGYESDNHTVGYFLRTNIVPEPATWMMLITGFGLVGYALRRRAPQGLATVSA